jgi:hydroxymethylglutaryl-CoA reductase
MIKGFSKLSKAEKIKFTQSQMIDQELIDWIHSAHLENKSLEELISNLSENVLAVYPLPYGVAPNFLIDGKAYIVPMVTEESSVVAAAAKSAGFWSQRGGFHTEIVGLLKTGQVHLKYTGESNRLFQFFEQIKPDLYKSVATIDAKMKSRGGGIQDISLNNKTKDIANYYQLHVTFDTCDAMGANYMNSCLESIAVEFLNKAMNADFGLEGETEVIMSILSNYSPESAVKVWVECPISELEQAGSQFTGIEFAKRFSDAVEIAEVDIHRAVTHNKGFYNGVDAVALATGNDWRAIESNGHAFASATGRYKSLSTVKTEGNMFWFGAIIPLQVGTVGGITNLHPLAKLSLQILKIPSAKELMKIMASVGLASNFAAIRSLITTGIQKGHMKMHLSNILLMFNANDEERTLAADYFSANEITYAAVERFIEKLRAG